MTKPTRITALQVQRFELSISLGWTAEERAEEQTVHLDIDTQFPKPPKACTTDKLKDTFCYDDLLVAISKHVSGKSFHLLEYLARDLYDFTKKRLPRGTKLKLRVTKHPNIAGLTDGVTFHYGDK